jgi:hypothetical protein
MFFDSGAISTVRAFFPAAGNDPIVTPYNVFNTGKGIDAKGSNYYIEEDGTLITFDQRGFASETLDFLYKDKVKDAGGTYFLKRGFELNIVKTDGSVGIADTTNLPNIKKGKVFGGLFMVTRKDDLYVMNPYDGTAYDLSGLFYHRFKEIIHVAHNYMITQDGTIYTIGFKEVELDGEYKMVPVVQSNITYGSRTAKLIGGNFFFDGSNNIHTIDYKGDLNKGDIERKMKVNIPSIEKDKSNKKSQTMGSNYFIYEDGEVYTVDIFGDVYFSTTLDQTQRVSTVNIPARK